MGRTDTIGININNLGTYTNDSSWLAQSIVIIIKTLKGQIPYEPDLGGNLQYLLGTPVTNLPALINDWANQLEIRLPNWVDLVSITPEPVEGEPFNYKILITVKRKDLNSTQVIEVG